MKPNMPAIGTVAAAAAVLVALTLQGVAHAQVVSAVTTGPNTNLGLVTSGEPRGYAFLMPITSLGRYPQVAVNLGPQNPFDPPDEWTWMVRDSDSALKSSLTFKWYAQASCPDALTLLQVLGPGGTQTQNPLWNPIWGYFYTQTFTVETVKKVCIDWSNANTCDPAEPGCDSQETFDLVGGVNPATSADRLHLKASCASGPVADTYYAPALRLTCNRDNAPSQ